MFRFIFFNINIFNIAKIYFGWANVLDFYNWNTIFPKINTFESISWDNISNFTESCFCSYLHLPQILQNCRIQPLLFLKLFCKLFLQAGEAFGKIKIVFFIR